MGFGTELRKPFGQANFLVPSRVSRLARGGGGCNVVGVLGCPGNRRPWSHARFSSRPRTRTLPGHRAHELRRAPHRRWPLGKWLLGTCCLFVSSIGCGRKATVDDCQRIVKRITELELKDVVSEQQIGSEISDAQQAFRERALSDCVGRRITEKSLACVETAATAAAIIDDCFD